MTGMTDERGGLPSASGMERLYQCPGSRSMEAGLPDISSPEAEEGSMIHEALESGDLDALKLATGRKAEICKEVEAQVVKDWSCENIESIVREERFWVRDRNTLKPIASAQLDVAMWMKFPFSRVLIMDYKTGWGVVTPSWKNIQMRIQALSLYSEAPTVKEIRVAIVRPLPKPHADTCDYKVIDLEMAYKELEFRSWLADKEDAPRVAGAWCRYCRAKATCPEAAAHAMLAVAVTRPMPMTKKGAWAAVGKLTLQQAALLHEKAPVINAILEAVKQRLKASPDLASVGYALIPGKTRVISDIFKAWREFGTLLTDKEFLSCCEMSIGALEELLANKAMKSIPPITKKEAIARAAKLLEPVSELKPQAPKLKRIPTNT